MVVHCKKEAYDVYIGRPSKWGNPFKGSNRNQNVADYKEYVRNSELYEQLEELRGKTLGCWCAPLRCHGDALVELLAERQV